jgi:hypothetical protein
MPRFESSTPSLIIYNTRTWVGYNEPVAPGYEHRKAPHRDGCEAFCVVRQVWPITRCVCRSLRRNIVIFTSPSQRLTHVIQMQPVVAIDAPHHLLDAGFRPPKGMLSPERQLLLRKAVEQVQCLLVGSRQVVQ